METAEALDTTFSFEGIDSELSPCGFSEIGKLLIKSSISSNKSRSFGEFWGVKGEFVDEDEELDDAGVVKKGSSPPLSISGVFSFSGVGLVGKMEENTFFLLLGTASSCSP